MINVYGIDEKHDCDGAQHAESDCVTKEIARDVDRTILGAAGYYRPPDVDVIRPGDMVRSLHRPTRWEIFKSYFGYQIPRWSYYRCTSVYSSLGIKVTAFTDER
jgi:hypothetical protein